MNFTIDETFSLYSYIIRIKGFSYYTLAHIFFLNSIEWVWFSPEGETI